MEERWIRQSAESSSQVSGVEEMKTLDRILEVLKRIEKLLKGGKKK